jgi:hypothetical protein
MDQFSLGSVRGVVCMEMCICFIAMERDVHEQSSVY